MIGKRLMALGLAGITALSLAACGGTSSGGGSGGTAAPSGNGSDTNAAQTESGNIKETGKSEGNAAANTEKSDKTLVVSMAAEPANLWAIGAGQADNQGQMVQNCIGDSLVNYDFENQEVLPCLATEWEWVDDKRIQFTLRDDVIMNDGTPLEAADVLYTVKMATEHKMCIRDRYICGAGPWHYRSDINVSLFFYEFVFCLDFWSCYILL